MSGRFEGKVAVVTGGGRGIGEGLSLLLAGEGAKVVVADLGGAVGGGGSDASVAQGVVDKIVAAGGTAIPVVADVADYAGARAVIDAAIENFGRVDILFNGAGILRSGKIEDTPENVWDDVIRVNLRSAYAMVHHAAPHMIKQRSGAIVNVSSPSGYGHYGAVAYATTKEALVGFTRSLARELGEHGIRCNAIRPCATTRMLLPEIFEDMRHVIDDLGYPPVGEFWLPGMNGEEPTGEVSNTAATIAWLCHPDTENLNGRTMYIAGGHLAFCLEPELIRSRYKAGGWDLDALLDPSVVTHFTYGQRNHFPQR